MSSSEIDYDKVNFFTIVGTFDAYITKVYDGDTVHAVFDPFNTGMAKFHVRLSGIDTPELKSKNQEEKIAAKHVRDVLSSCILNKKVSLNCEGFDKYGRLLADIVCEGESINKKLINDGLAKPYFGGTKESFN